MILKEFALLASDTARTKAYLQRMIYESKLPEACIVYSDNLQKMEDEAWQYQEGHADNEYFDIEEPIIFSLRKAGIPYVKVDDKDINSNQMAEAIREISPKYLIYSGYGGYILQSHLFQLGKKFIHVHAGILPQYRGSTTFYYSLLQEHRVGATAIFLNEGIDEGEIIIQNTFDVPSEVPDIDYVYEPFIRSKVLIEAIDQYIQNGILLGKPQKQDGEETYFIIHPVLKHLALLGIEDK